MLVYYLADIQVLFLIFSLGAVQAAANSVAGEALSGEIDQATDTGTDAVKIFVRPSLASVYSRLSEHLLHFICIRLFPLRNRQYLLPLHWLYFQPFRWSE